jgi:hypothetical protein
VCAGATVGPSYIQQAFAQQQPGGLGRVLHAPGTFMLSAPGQSSGVFLIDTRTGETWYNKNLSTWVPCGSPVADSPAGRKSEQTTQK